MTRSAERGMIHRGQLEDRGAEHAHRWQPLCSCGWRGVPGKTKWARQQLRDHKRSIDHHDRIIQRGRVPARQRLTPLAELPEELR